MEQPLIETDAAGSRVALAKHLCDAFVIPASRPPVIEPVARGAVGRVWRLDAAPGTYAVKEFFWGADEDDARREAAFRDAAARAGVRSPVNVRTPAGRYLWKLPSELGGRQVRLYSWVPGETVREEEAGVSAEIGDLLGRLHSVRAPTTAAPDPWYEVVPDEERWRLLKRSAAAAGTPWAEELGQALPAIAGLAALLTPTTAAELTICHSDLQASNILRDSHGLILLDWDNVGPGSRERELASTLLGWERRNGLTDRPGALAMLTAYREAGGRATIDSPAAFGMAIATHLNFIFVQAELALDVTASADHRENANLWTAQGLATLPGPSVFDELIEVVRGHDSTFAP
jgi:Ser/Thr protein kinase RdoA (MazF antagonist)